jgi:hypothetical protein
MVRLVPASERPGGVPPGRPFRVASSVSHAPTVPPPTSLPAECWRVARDDNRPYPDAGSRATMMVETTKRVRWVVSSERRPSWPPVTKRLRLLDGSVRRCAEQ